MHAAVSDKTKQADKLPAKPPCRAPIAVYETGDAYRIYVELSGADPRSLQVQVQQGILTIKAALAVELPPAGAKLQYSEFALGDYRRSLAVGDGINEEKIEAQFSHGLLSLVLPKSKVQISSKRRIPICSI